MTSASLSLRPSASSVASASLTPRRRGDVVGDRVAAFGERLGRRLLAVVAHHVVDHLEIVVFPFAPAPSRIARICSLVRPTRCSRLAAGRSRSGPGPGENTVEARVQAARPPPGRRSRVRASRSGRSDVRPKHAGAEVDRAVLDVEQQRVGVELVLQHRDAFDRLGEGERCADAVVAFAS